MVDGPFARQQHVDVVSRVETVGLMAVAIPIAAIDARRLEGAHSGSINITRASVELELLIQADTIEQLG